MGRPKSKDSRRSKAEKKRAEKAAKAAAGLAAKGTPNAAIVRRRKAFSFLGGGNIDQDICDAIGQLKALGLLDGHGYDAIDLRNIGREYAELRAERYAMLEPRVSSFERLSPSTGEPPPRSPRDDRFDKLDDALPRVGIERVAIHMLLTEFHHSDGMTGWAHRLINRELAKRGAADTTVLLDTPTEGHDRHMLNSAIRGLCLMYEATLAPRGIKWAA